MFNEGFYELFSLLEKQKGSQWHIRCHTFNTRANRVVIVCSEITKIFNPMQMLVTFQPVLMTLVIYFVLVNNVPVASYLLFASLFDLLFDFYSVLYLMQVFVRFNFIVQFSCSHSKYSVLSLECIPGIMTRQQQSSSESINIIHQTAPSLS